MDKAVLDNLRGKYIKRTLQLLEKNNTLTPAIRKVIIDNINDMVRELALNLHIDLEKV